MSRSYNKVATTGFAVSNHKANSKYYKQQRKSARNYSRHECDRMIKEALDEKDYFNELEHSINNYYNNKNTNVVIYNRKERKLHRNTWDEPTDGRYIWFKPRKDKKKVHGIDWRCSYKDHQTAQELYKIYSRK